MKRKPGMGGADAARNRGTLQEALFCRSESLQPRT
jgi:hypothetical protein